MRDLILLMVMVPLILLLLSYTKANIWSFWLGMLLCLSAESSILIVYCVIKLQTMYSDSLSVTLNESINHHNQTIA